MKKMRMIALATFAAISLSVSAQESFSTVYLQYNPSSLKYSHDGYSLSTNYNAFTLGYSYSLPVTNSIPLYLEFGGAAQYAFKSEDDVTNNYLGIKIPVDVMYSIEFSDVFQLQPYAGFFGRVGIIGKTKDKHHDVTSDWFSDLDGKRFQFGINAGAKVRISQKFTAGVGYYLDLTKVQEHTHFEGFDIMIGLTF